mmetsp:Transcript_20927/g.49690  ORF Transcript_20927/g.49690 Transcript_20927/m.49690 type:complete len:429 (+) Transcript_20927:123-1409(+)
MSDDDFLKKKSTSFSISRTATKTRRSYLRWRWLGLVVAVILQLTLLQISIHRRHTMDNDQNEKGDKSIITSTSSNKYLHPLSMKKHFSIDDVERLKTRRQAASSKPMSLNFTTKEQVDAIVTRGDRNSEVRPNSWDSDVITASTTNTNTNTNTSKSLRSMFDGDHHRPGFKYPPFRMIVRNHKKNEIIGSPQFLLDFAIVGFPKCGTSTMMEWLGYHSQVSCFQGETPHLSKGRIGLFIKRLYNGLDSSPQKLRGYKNPTDISNLKATRLLREYFPETRLFVGIRHPVLWFQSFYNHRIQNTGKMPHPSKLFDGCTGDSQGVCSKRAQYHLALVRLGKTNYTSERDAFNDEEWNHLLKDEPKQSPNPVFLYATEQLGDKNSTRVATFRRHVQQFLGLTVPLDEHPHYSPGKDLNETLQAERNKLKIDI